MRELIYLWKRREHAKDFPRFCVIWAKRMRHLPGLCRFLFAQRVWRLRGAQVGEFTAINNSKTRGRMKNLSVGPECSLGQCELNLHDRISIGRRVVINDGVVILTASHDLDDPRWGLVRTAVEIDDYAWVARNAILLPGVRIGRGATIGAGAVVRGEVAPYAVVVGNPAVASGRIRTSDLRYVPGLMNAPLESWVGSSYSGD
jgi:maltose O-acetyltransferase